MRVYEARPKGGRLTGAHKKAMHAAGFGWTGNAWLCKAEKLPKVWGCTVRIYRPPVARDPISVMVGMLTGTHDEFGRRK